MVLEDIMEDMADITTLESDLLMLNPKASHGYTDTVVMVLEDIMEDMADITTLESDLLMLSQKATHGTDTAAMVLAVMVLAMVDIMVGENKPSKSYYNNESKFKKKLL